MPHPLKWPMTLADSPAIMAEYHVPDTPFDTASGTTEVFAPCCGRRCPADCVLDVRHVPGTVVAAGGVRPPRDHDWLCDGCRFRLYADPAGGWTRSRLLALCGAPPDAVREFKVQERVEAMARAAFAAGRAHDPKEARVLVALEVDRVA
jgi:hypothetical protein